MIKIERKRNNGITLIALVITIIVLLILAGVSIAFLTADNGIIIQATAAREKNEIASVKEQAQLDIANWVAEQLLNGRDTTVASADDVKNILNEALHAGGEQYWKELSDTAIITENGYEVPYSELYTTGSGTDEGISIGDIFNPEGDEEGKLHIGDFVNYTAGTWTENEINEIGANNSTDLPSEDFQFGGFTVGSSRDGNAIPGDSSYNYVKNKSTGEAITGWRVFDVDETNGTVTLISAGCPEDYYHPWGTNYGYISEFILTKNVNSNANADSLGLGDTYLPRDWSMYVNEAYGATSATVLTKAKLDAWYSKYMGIDNADTYDDLTFQSIYGNNYESLIDNYSYYWLSSAGNGYSVFNVNPYFRNVGGGNGVKGVRVQVSLSSDVKFSEENSGTKTVESRGEEYTYNVWDIEM